jgi:phosphatidylserine decarboxylase
MTIAKEGYPFIIILAVGSIVLFVFHLTAFAIVLLILCAFVAFFFRDPERSFALSGSQVVSPADGKVISVRKENDLEVLSIFLSIFDVHINRAPVSGEITRIEYKKGKFLAAFDERASNENEQNSITIDHEGHSVRFVQIAGLIARRIICWKKEGEKIAAGERIGLIKFGSRVDVFLPSGSMINVKVGQKVRAGETIIGEVK